MIAVHNRQRALRIDVGDLQAFAESALEACLKIPGKQGSRLTRIEEINVLLVSDRRIAELHWRFMHVRGPTDVITFQHGDIVVSAETARKQAQRFGTSVRYELHLYLVHGLLHLHGFDDKEASGAAEMAQVQERLVALADNRRRKKG